MSRELRAKVAELIADILQVEITPDTEDFHRYECDDWDSVNHLRLIMEIEAVFGIGIDDERAADLSSLQQIESLLISSTP
jgi:acyl carrier protein